MFPSQFQYKTSVHNEMFPYEENGGFTFKPFYRDDELVTSSGGQAIVFKVIDSNKKNVALKLFLHELDDRFNRFKVLSDFIQQNRNNFFLPFQFIEKLIYVDVNANDVDNYFPGVIMDWIDAPTMEEKLRLLVTQKDTESIKIIANNFKSLSLKLIDLKIAHGDLKMSNILIDDSLNLYLIDYDGMYVPQFRGNHSIENGTPSYQHPRRQLNDFNENIDHFSILNIYTSLLLVAINPELYLKYNDGDNILFRTNDLLDPLNSELFNITISDDYIKNLVVSLKLSLLSGNIYFSNILEILNGNFPQPEINISHKGSEIFIGDIVEFKWASQNCNKIKINGIVCDKNDHLDLLIKSESISVSIENDFSQKSFVYHLTIKKKPIIQSFKSDTTAIKKADVVNLNWDVIDYEKIILEYNSMQYDVTNLNSFNISDLQKSQFLLLRAFPINSSVYVEEKIFIDVSYPIKLEIIQDRRIVFRNQPLTIKIFVENANFVSILPLNEDITGLTEFAFRPNQSMTYTVIAKNKFYNKQVEIFIEVSQPPNYSNKIILLPRFEIKIPFLMINKSTWQNHYFETKKKNKIFFQYKNLFKKFKFKKIKL